MTSTGRCDTGGVAVAVADAERALQEAGEAFERLDLEGVIAHTSTAVRIFTAAGEKCRAAMACVQLGDAYSRGIGNRTASRAWYVRARRLVENEPECLVQGWVAVAG